jgi:hypothetical protein
MECVDRDPPSMRPRLEQLLRRRGGEHGTDSVALAMGCFLWLEERKRFGEILALGTFPPPEHLAEFMQVR